MNLLLIAVGVLFAVIRAAACYLDPHPGNQFNLIMSLLLAGVLIVGSLEQPDYV